MSRDYEAEHREYLANVEKGKVFYKRALELATEMYKLQKEFEESGAERVEIGDLDDLEVFREVHFGTFYWVPSSYQC